MKSFAILCFACCIVLSFAWPIIPDDKEQRIREAEEIAAKDLQAFKKAYAAKDNTTLAELTKYPLAVVNDVWDNTFQIYNELRAVVGLLEQLVQPNVFPELRQKILNLITSALDGNRDNLSYYRLDAVREWLERRTQKDGAYDFTLFTDARTRVLAARDALDKMSKAFVAGVKEIKELTSLGFDQGKVRLAVYRIAIAYEDNKDVLLMKSAQTGHALQKAVDAWSGSQ